MNANRRHQMAARGLLACLVLVGFILSARIAAADPGRTVPPSGKPQDLIAFLVSAGESALRAARFTEAEERFRAVLERDWNHPRAFELLQRTRAARARALAAWEAQGHAAMAQRDWDEAIISFGRLAAEDSTRADIRDLIPQLTRRREAELYIRSGLEKFIREDYASAQAEFTRAVALVPDDTLAQRCRDRVGEYLADTAAVGDLMADAATWGKYVQALQLFRTGDLDGAERLWREVLDAHPGNAAVRSNLDLVRRRRGGGDVAAAP